MTFKLLRKLMFACGASLLTSMAAHASPMVTISAYGLDLNAPYGYQRIGTNADSEISYTSPPFVAPLGSPAGIYADLNYPAIYQGYGYANGASGILKASAAATGLLTPTPLGTVPWRYVETWVSASGIITIGTGDEQTGTITLRQHYDGTASITGTPQGGSPIIGMYLAEVSYRKVGETQWKSASADNLSDNDVDGVNELVLDVIAGEQYEIYEQLMARAEVVFGATTELDFSHTSVLSVSSSSGITVSGENGFLSGILNQPVNAVPEPTPLALLLAGLSGTVLGWRKRATLTTGPIRGPMNQ